MAEAVAAPQYPSKRQFDKLVAYVQELVKDHNALEERVKQLENHEASRQRIENEVVERRTKKLAAKAVQAANNECDRQQRDSLL